MQTLNQGASGGASTILADSYTPACSSQLQTTLRVFSLPYRKEVDGYNLHCTGSIQVALKRLHFWVQCFIHVS